MFHNNVDKHQVLYMLISLYYNNVQNDKLNPTNNNGAHKFQDTRF